MASYIKMISFSGLSESKGKLPAMVSAYDVIIKSCVGSYVELSFSIDAEVFKQATMVINKSNL